MSASPDVLVVEDDQDMADALLHLLEIWGFSARHAEHGKAALEAVKQWEYMPTLLKGVPVEVVMNVTVSFKLN